MVTIAERVIDLAAEGAEAMGAIIARMEIDP
jgi:hypothetical protein